MSRQPQEESIPPEGVRAEAAAWVARLHDEQRTPDLDAQVRAWLGESEAHRRAFARMTQAWDRAGEIRLRAHRDAAPTSPRARARVLPWAATAAAAALVLSVGAITYFWSDNAVVTGIGQQRIRVLQDGTRVVLNTETRIEVSYDERERRVRLIRGEARFDVSRHASWPFLVSVDGREIRALGTSFIVRHDDEQDLSVTLVEGQISVAPIARHDEVGPPDPQILSPGQRLMISRNHAPAVDRPELTRITAWEHGRVEFEATPLAEAASEMNRYSKSHVTVADPDTAQLRVGGVFRAGDSDEFVRIVTSAFGLEADHRGGDIVLSRPSITRP
jgi:transmembrane sensor